MLNLTDEQKRMISIKENEQRLPPGSLLRDFTQLRQKAEQSFTNGQRYNFSNYDIMLESDYNSITGQELVPGSWYVNFDANQNNASTQPNQGIGSNTSNRSLLTNTEQVNHQQPRPGQPLTESNTTKTPAQQLSGHNRQYDPNAPVLRSRKPWDEPPGTRNKYGIPLDFSGKNPLLQLTYYIDLMRWDLYEEVNVLLDQYETPNTKPSLSNMADVVANHIAGHDYGNSTALASKQAQYLPASPVPMSQQENLIRQSVARTMGHGKTRFPIENYEQLKPEQKQLMAEQRKRLLKAFGLPSDNIYLPNK